MPSLQQTLGLLLCSRALAQPACVLSPSGTMLCCGPDDYECVARVQKAHEEPPSSPPAIRTEAPVLFGSMYTFANSPLWDRSTPFDVAVVGVPFGLQNGNEAPGMQTIRREVSRIPAYSRLYGASIKDLTVVDGQDLVVGGDSVDRFKSLTSAAEPFFKTGKPVVALGGDHSITVPLMRAAVQENVDFAVIHIDKDLAIGTGSREQPLTASTAMFWGAAQKLFDVRHSMHIGVRGNLDSQKVELLDQELGFQTVLVEDFELHGVLGIVQKVKERLSRRDGTFMPAYLSLNFDVLDLTDPGGLSPKALRALLAGMRPFCVLRGAELRGIDGLTDAKAVKVAASIAHDLVLLAGRRSDKELVAANLQHEL